MFKVFTLGWDRHLFALRTFAEMEYGGWEKLPAIFKDSNYKRINEIILSTSTLSSPALQAATFAPTSPNGYGIGYRIDVCHFRLLINRFSGPSLSFKVIASMSTFA